MKEENSIEVRNITKKFKVYYDKGSQLKEKLLFKKRNHYENRCVLNDISFDVKKGEAIGFIGHNGCGKSTTLKLLTKIIYPDTGVIEMKGRIASLIELGAGFHPDMSGRENIYTNASIFGLTRKEINERIDDIIKFSELEEFMDNPVRTYSSGMYMRLAFSVAINVDADILLIDEILAVGDVNFQAKCFERLREIKANGTTIVIVSHSMGQIEQICDRSIWIHEGKIKAEGIPRNVHLEYLDYMGHKRQEIVDKEITAKEEKENKQDSKHSEKTVSKKAESTDETHSKPEEKKKRWGNGMAKIETVKILNQEKKSQTVFETGDDITIHLEYSINEIIKDAVIGIGIFRNDGLQCYGSNTSIDALPAYSLEKDGILEIVLEKVNLLPGKYLLDVAIESESGIPVDCYREAAWFDIFSVTEDVGVTRIAHSWNFQM